MCVVPAHTRARAHAHAQVQVQVKARVRVRVRVHARPRAFFEGLEAILDAGGGSFSNTDFGSFSNTDVLDHFRTQSGSFSNTWGGYPAAPVGLRVGVGWGSYVRLLLRDRATAPWGWGWGWGGAVAFASYCVTMRLHPGTGEGGN